jgi:hypothetical protein
MGSGIWNSYTRLSIFSDAMAGLLLILGFIGGFSSSVSGGFIIAAAVLVVAGLIAEGYGVYRAQHFFKEDARRIYAAIVNMIKELRSLAPVLHQGYDNQPVNNGSYDEDPRYRQLVRNIDREKKKCVDYRLKKRLDQLVECEIRMAKYRIDPTKNNFPITLNSVNGDITKYINTRLKSRIAKPVDQE